MIDRWICPLNCLLGEHKSIGVVVQGRRRRKKEKDRHREQVIWKKEVVILAYLLWCDTI